MHRIGGRQRNPCFGVGGVAVGIPLLMNQVSNLLP